MFWAMLAWLTLACSSAFHLWVSFLVPEADAPHRMTTIWVLWWVSATLAVLTTLANFLVSQTLSDSAEFYTLLDVCIPPCRARSLPSAQQGVIQLNKDAGSQDEGCVHAPLEALRPFELVGCSRRRRCRHRRHRHRHRRQHRHQHRRHDHRRHERCRWRRPLPPCTAHS